MVVPPEHPKMIIFRRKTNGCWVPPFQETPIFPMGSKHQLFVHFLFGLPGFWSFNFSSSKKILQFTLVPMIFMGGGEISQTFTWVFQVIGLLFDLGMFFSFCDKNKVWPSGCKYVFIVHPLCGKDYPGQFIGTSGGQLIAFRHSFSDWVETTFRRYCWKIS